jgi:hypothetical protein
MLTPRPGRGPAVLDTDTYNEIDDQFALVLALLSPGSIARGDLRGSVPQ